MRRINLLLLVFTFVFVGFNQNAFSFNDTTVGDVEMVDRTILFNDDECFATLQVWRPLGDNDIYARCTIKALGPNDLRLYIVSEARKQLKSGGSAYVSLDTYDPDEFPNYGKDLIALGLKNDPRVGLKKPMDEILSVLRSAFQEGWPEGMKFRLITLKGNSK